jgi:hypothetical protein
MVNVFIRRDLFRILVVHCAELYFLISYYIYMSENYSYSYIYKIDHKGEYFSAVRSLKYIALHIMFLVIEYTHKID